MKCLFIFTKPAPALTVNLRDRMDQIKQMFGNCTTTCVEDQTTMVTDTAEIKLNANSPKIIYPSYAPPSSKRALQIHRDPPLGEKHFQILRDPHLGEEHFQNHLDGELQIHQDSPLREGSLQIHRDPCPTAAPRSAIATLDVEREHLKIYRDPPVALESHLEKTNAQSKGKIDLFVDVFLEP